jgi:hypothetical protein
MHAYTGCPRASDTLFKTVIISKRVLNLDLSTLNPEEVNFVTFIQILWSNFGATKSDRNRPF